MFFLLSPHVGTRKDSPFMDPYRIQLARFNFKSPGNLRIRGFFLKRIFPPEILKSMLEDILLKSTKKGGWQLNRKFWSHKNPLLINCWFFILALKNWVTLLVGGFKQSEKYESKWESSPAQVEVKIKKNETTLRLGFCKNIQRLLFFGGRCEFLKFSHGNFRWFIFRLLLTQEVRFTISSKELAPVCQESRN